MQWVQKHSFNFILTTQLKFIMDISFWKEILAKILINFWIFFVNSRICLVTVPFWDMVQEREKRGSCEEVWPA